MKSLLKMTCLVLCISFFSGCFYWHKDEGAYRVKLDPVPKVVLVPATTTIHVLGSNPVAGVTATATFLGLGLATLSSSAILLALQYPFIPKQENLQIEYIATDFVDKEQPSPYDDIIKELEEYSSS